MEIAIRSDGRRGVQVSGFDPATAGSDDLAQLRRHLYHDKIVVLRAQRLSPAQFIALGREFGTPAAYYEPMYHHPEHDLIFVSSNLNHDTGPIGVPKTGAFWHSDYQFMPDPFSATLFYPQRLPAVSRGTYFIDMAEAYARLSPRLRAAVENTYCRHSARRYVKIRPADVYRPLGEVIAEVERKTPAQRRPTVLTHPVTSERILHVTEAFTYEIEDADGNALPKALIDELLTESGQLDPTFEHPNIFLQGYAPGDLVVWDNRTLIHRALHNPTDEPAESFRVTVHDEYPVGVEVSA